MLILFIVVVVGSFLPSSSASKYYNYWSNIEPFFREVAYPHHEKVVKLVSLLEANVKMSTSCRSSLSAFKDGLESGDPKSFAIFDSFGRFKPGFLGKLKTVDFGHYDQCLDSQGRYVLLAIHMPLVPDKDIRQSWINQPGRNISWMEDFRLRTKTMFHITPMLIGVCFPSGCSGDDVRGIISSPFIKYLSSPAEVKVYETEEDGERETFFDDYQNIRLFSRTLIIGLILCMMIGTFVTSSTFFSFFEAKTNTSKMFQESTNPRLEFFNGFKTIYFVVCMFAHYGTPINDSSLPFMNEITDFIDNHPSLIGLCKVGFVIVSVNFVVTASLSVISWLPEMIKRKGRVSFSSYIFLRVCRTFPMTFVTIVANFTFPLMTFRGGPRMYHVQKNFTQNCYDNGWKEIFFVGNLGNPVYNCSVISWFAATDFQLYAISFIGLVLLYKKPFLGILFAVGQIVVGILLTGFEIIRHDASPSVVMFLTTDVLKVKGNFHTLYIQPHTNMATYGVGILFGYLVVMEYELPKKLRRLSWLVFSFILIGTASLPIYLYDGVTFTASRDFEIVLGAAFRASAGIGLAGLLYMCWLEPDAILSRFLSAKIFTPIARISYSIFMTHIFIISFMHGMQRELFYLTLWNVLEKMVFLFVASVALGYFAFICVEAPFYNMVKAALSPKVRKHPDLNANSIGMDKKGE